MAFIPTTPWRTKLFAFFVSDQLHGNQCAIKVWYFLRALASGSRPKCKEHLQSLLSGANCRSIANAQMTTRQTCDRAYYCI